MDKKQEQEVALYVLAGAVTCVLAGATVVGGTTGLGIALIVVGVVGGICLCGILFGM